MAGGVLHSLLSKYAILFAEHCIRVAVSNVKMVPSSRSAFNFMQNNTAFNALSENHCKYTELAHQFGSRGAEGPIFLTLNPKPCLLKLLKLCSQGAHPTSSKTKSHTVFVALIETHCNHAELAHQFESRGVEGPIF